MPDGSIQTFSSVEEAQAAAEALGKRLKPFTPQAEAGSPVPGSLQNLQGILDGLKEKIKGAELPFQPPFLPKAATNALQSVLGDLVGVAAHPIKEGPTAGAMLGAGAAGLLAPELTLPAMGLRALAAGGGGTLGGLLRGDTPQQALTGGALQGAMQMGGEGVLGGAGTLMRAGGRSLGARALKPGPDILAELRNPATTKPFTTPGEAYDYFKSQVMEVAPGTPGTVPYAKNLMGRTERAVTDKATLLGNQPPENLIDRAVALQGAPEKDRVLDVVKRSLNSDAPDEARESIREAARQFMPDAGRPILDLNPESGLPNRDFIGLPMTTSPAAPNQPWAPKEVADIVTQMNSDLTRRYATQYGANMKGGRVPSNWGDETRMAIRGNLADALHEAVPEVATLDTLLSQTIPFRKAAQQATAPNFGNSLRGSVVMSRGGPGVRGYEPASNLMNSFSRPLYNAGGSAMKGATFLPNSLRLAYLLAGQEP